MKILVAGGLRPEFKEGNAEEVCARALGRAITSDGHHVLLNSAYNNFDRLVAEAAWEVAQKSGKADAAIHTYVTPGVDPAHKLGQVRKLSQLGPRAAGLGHPRATCRMRCSHRHGRRTRNP